MEFEEKEAREKGGEKKKKNQTVWGFIAVTPFPQCDVYCQHRLPLDPSARSPTQTHTHNPKIFTCAAHAHLNAGTPLLKVFFKGWYAIIWITCCTAMSPPP